MQVSSRLVIFVGGFDPRGSRHYHRMMRKESSKQAQVSQHNYTVSSRSRWKAGAQVDLNHSSWVISAENERASDYVFVDWSGVVRSQWKLHFFQVLWQSLTTYALIIRDVSLKHLKEVTPYVLWTLAYPIVYFFLCLLFLALAVTVFKCIDGIIGFIMGGVIVWGSLILDRILHVGWLLRILNFARHSASEPFLELNNNLEKTADVIANEIISERYEEVVIVGFSVGSALAVSLLYAIRKQLQKRNAAGRIINLLTLGNCIPLFSLLPKAENFREKLHSLAEDPHLYWVDVSSPSDSVSFGMCDLMRLSLPALDATVASHLINPRYMCTPRFHKLFPSKIYSRLRYNKMRMHFQYLMASELPGAYNYFSLLTCSENFSDFIEKKLVR